MIPRRLGDFLLAGFAVSAAMVAAGAPHPRLLLTPASIAELKTSMATTRAGLWPAVRESAEEFSRLEAPSMRDAGNRYRTLGDTLPVLALAYHLTGEPRFAAAADRWVNTLLDVPDWRGSQNLGRAAWVVGSATIYDWLPMLPAATRERIRTRLVAEGEILLREAAYWRLLSNHCLIETAALGMIGLALEGEHERAPAFLAKARERADLIIEHAPVDGSWAEGIQYWQYGLGYFLRYLEAARTAGHYDYYARYDWLRQTGYFAIHFSLPGRPTESVNFADSGMADYVAGFLFYLPAARYGNGHFQDFANRTHPVRPYKFSWMDFIAYDSTVKPVDFTGLPAFHHFADHGFVIMRSGWSAGDSLVAFHCGPGPGHRNQAHPLRRERRGFGPGHAHPDTNSFSFFAHGQWLVVDPGYVHEKWTRDENTLLVNGRGQAGEGAEWLDYAAFQEREPTPRILRAESTPAFDYVIGDAGNVYVDEANVRHFRRHLLFLKPGTVVVLDDVEARRPSRFDWRLHAREPAVAIGSGGFETSRDGARLWIQPILPESVEARASTDSVRAARSRGTVATLDLGVDAASRVTYLVVLAALPDASAARPTASFSAGRLSIAQAGKTWRVDVRDPVPSDPGCPLLQVAGTQ